MTALALVRHGRTRWNLERRLQGLSDLPLDAVGTLEAHAAARTLAAWEWTQVISSPLLRARETATFIAEHLKTGRPIIDDELLERDYGVAEGVTVQEAQRRWPDGIYPSGETAESLAIRTRSVFERLGALEHPTVVVGHGAFLRSGIEAVTGASFPRLLNGDVVFAGHGAPEDATRTFHLMAR